MWEQVHDAFEAVQIRGYEDFTPTCPDGVHVSDPELGATRYCDPVGVRRTVVG